jgi:hypothetical protein
MAPEVFIGMLEGRDLLIHSVPINEGGKSKEIDPVLDGLVKLVVLFERTSFRLKRFSHSSQVFCSGLDVL